MNAFSTILQNGTQFGIGVQEGDDFHGTGQALGVGAYCKHVAVNIFCICHGLGVDGRIVFFFILCQSVGVALDDTDSELFAFFQSTVADVAGFTQSLHHQQGVGVHGSTDNALGHTLYVVVHYRGDLGTEDGPFAVFRPVNHIGSVVFVQQRNHAVQVLETDVSDEIFTLDQSGQAVDVVVIFFHQSLVDEQIFIFTNGTVVGDCIGTALVCQGQEGGINVGLQDLGSAAQFGVELLNGFFFDVTLVIVKTTYEEDVHLGFFHFGILHNGDAQIVYIGFVVFRFCLSFFFGFLFGDTLFLQSLCGFTGSFFGKSFLFLLCCDFSHPFVDCILVIVFRNSVQFDSGIKLGLGQGVDGVLYGQNGFVCGILGSGNPQGQGHGNTGRFFRVGTCFNGFVLTGLGRTSGQHGHCHDNGQKEA